MDFNGIQDAWSHQPDPGAARTDDELIHLVVSRDRSLRRRVKVRDFIELGTAVTMAAGFVWVATQAAVRWPWIAAAVVTLAVGGVFVRERLRRPPPAQQATELRASLQQALGEVDHQVRLLGSVFWWYLLPLGAVVVLIVVGTWLGARAEMDAAVWARARWLFMLSFAAVLLVTGGLYWLVWWGNMRVVRRHLLPQRDEIVESLRQLSVDEEEGCQ
ncbi:MAG TPA: hypothetical protein VGK32_00390 [Vicinamibacterales bacterium]|jgi:hypothetical protein